MSSKRRLNFDGKPSRILDKRPFVSIIIPINNPNIEKFRNLLESIYNQDMEDEMEVIIVDDKSMVRNEYRVKDIYDVVEEFTDELCIKFIKLKNCVGAGSARNIGVVHATGEWLLFLNMEDDLITNSLKKNIKALLDRTEEKLILFSSFLETDYDKGYHIREVEEDIDSVTGKLFNKDNFWDKFELEFPQSEFAEKALMNNVAIILSIIGHQPIYSAHPFVSRPVNIGVERYYDGFRYMTLHFKDFVKANFDIYCQYYTDTEFNPKCCFDNIVDTVLYMYFVTQAVKFKGTMRDTMVAETCNDYFFKFKKVFGISNKQILDYVSIYFKNRYSQIRVEIEKNEGMFIESETFFEWMNNIHEDIEASFSIDKLLK